MKIEFKRLDHIQICIPAGKEEGARKFYTEIIGLKEISKPAELIINGGLWFEIADIQLHIGIENEMNKSKRHPAFEISNLPEVRKHLEKNEIKIKNETHLPGQNRFSFCDPFGNRIEFLERSSGFVS